MPSDDNSWMESGNTRVDRINRASKNCEAFENSRCLDLHESYKLSEMIDDDTIINHLVLIASKYLLGNRVGV